ncbi:60S ribosomal protein L5-2 [Abeliophyllum distichum]|uniref:60S ribosomal protein L5-2 n=1 Tax=Abeliophyllum distichum TaxID=126358 RepID=A0ABD1RUM9_9LAMI
MVFVKAQKSKAYFKRFQVKYKRRREEKTDYRARIRLINQDKNNLMYRASFGSSVLKKLEVDDEYEGNVEATGEDYSVEPAKSRRRPFRTLLDIGLVRTTIGNRVFGALKGALDGGLDIPHSDKRFVGFSKDSKQLDAEVHRKYIYGDHIAANMTTLMEDEPEKYRSHFSYYIKKGLEADGLEEMYKKVHAAIRADPTAKKSEKEPTKEHKRYHLNLDVHFTIIVLLYPFQILYMQFLSSMKESRN